MSTKRMMKQLDQYERSLVAESKQPVFICFADDIDKIEAEENILYLESVDVDAYKDLPPLTPADETRYLRDLGL